jgi:predicted peptidase
MKKVTLFFVLGLLGFLQVANGQVVADWVVELHEPHIYNEMPYRLMKPINFDSKKRYPVIVSLHGGGGRGSDNLKQLRDWNEVLAEEQRRTDYPCYLLAPQSEGRWDSTQLQKVKDIIKELPSVNMNRIYVLGHSMGGGGTYTFIRSDPDYFAAAAPSAGGGLRHLPDASVVKDLPIWTFHGDQDNVVPIEGDQKLFAEMQKIGGNMKFTTWVGDGHGVAPQMIAGSDNASTQLSSDRCDPEPVFMKWLFAQKRTPAWVKLHEPHLYNDMPYRIMKPIDFNPRRSYPVIVSLHGAGGRGSDNMRQLRNWNEVLAEEQNRTDYPSYVLVPQASEMWNATHLQNIKDIIKDLPSVNINRIYIYGHSMGGEGTFRLIQSDPDYFAAAASSAGGGLARNEEFIDASIIKDIPIWAFHGDQDGVCPIERIQSVFAEMQKIDGNMKFTTWAGDGHGIPLKNITGSDNGSTQLSSERCNPEPVFLKWLFAQKKTPDWVKLHEPHIYNDMNYRLLKPINFNPKKSYPLIVSLHGAGGRGSDNVKQLRDWNELLAEEQRRIDYPAYILAPQSEVRWNSTHLQNVKDIIKDLPAVDTKRIYVLGHSMGGRGTYAFIQSDPKYFAAAAPSAGNSEDVDASVIKDIPIWIFYGDKDKIESARTIFAKMQEIDGNMKFTTWVGDGHGVAPKMIAGSDNGSTQMSSDRCDPEPVFMKWLISQKLKNGRR